jgi:hypothetical protein
MSWLRLMWYILLVTGLTLVYGFVWSLCKTASDYDDKNGMGDDDNGQG